MRPGRSGFELIDDSGDLIKPANASLKITYKTLIKKMWLNCKHSLIFGKTSAYF
mgnify:CR=1 FL=1